ncbi:hypothetical protein [Amycolatopsis sp. NPDC004378]
MAIRTIDAAPDTPSPIGDPADGTRSDTALDPLPWNSLVPWFLAQADLPAGITFGYRGKTHAGPEWATFAAPDRSWCTVRIQPKQDGRREVRQGGPTAIWPRVEAAAATWVKLGYPDWSQIGITVRPNGSNRIWVDRPDSNFGWNLHR